MISRITVFLPVKENFTSSAPVYCEYAVTVIAYILLSAQPPHVIVLQTH